MNNNYNTKPTVFPIVDDLAPHLRSSDWGITIPTFLRFKMEYAFKADFSNVKIYLSQKPHEFNAIAFASTESIYILPEHYQPKTFTGQVLIGHELAHIVQQRRQQVNHESNSVYPQVVEDSDLEQEADWCGFLAALGLQTPLAKPFLLSPLLKQQASSPIIQCVKREYPYQDNKGNTHHIKTYELLKVLDKVVEDYIEQAKKNALTTSSIPNKYQLTRFGKTEATVAVYTIEDFSDWLKTYKHLTNNRIAPKGQPLIEAWYPSHLNITATERHAVINTGNPPSYDAYLINAKNLEEGKKPLPGDNHSYNMVAKEATKLVKEHKIGDDVLAQAILDVATGKQSDLCKNNPAISAFVTDITTLMFGIEASRDKLFFATNFMMMDLIAKKATFGKNNKPFSFANVFDAVYNDINTGQTHYKPFVTGEKKYRKTGTSSEWQDEPSSYMAPKKKGKPVGNPALINPKSAAKSPADEIFDYTKADGGKKEGKRNPMGGKHPGTGLDSGSKNYHELGVILQRTHKEETLKAVIQKEFNQPEYRIRHAALLKSASASVHWLIADDKTNPFKDKMYGNEQELLDEVKQIFKKHIFEERLLSKQDTANVGVSAASANSTSSMDTNKVPLSASMSKITLKETDAKYEINGEQLIELTAGKTHELLGVSEESFFKVLKDAKNHQLMDEIFQQDIAPSLIGDDKGKSDLFAHIIELIDNSGREEAKLKSILNEVKAELDLNGEISEAHEEIIDKQQTKVNEIEQQINKYFGENFIDEYAELYRTENLPLNYRLVELWAEQKSVNLEIWDKDDEFKTLAKNEHDASTTIYLLAQDGNIISRLATEAEVKALLDKSSDKAADKTAVSHSSSSSTAFSTLSDKTVSDSKESTTTFIKTSSVSSIPSNAVNKPFKPPWKFDNSSTTSTSRSGYFGYSSKSRVGGWGESKENPAKRLKTVAEKREATDKDITIIQNNREANKALLKELEDKILNDEGYRDKVVKEAFKGGDYDEDQTDEDILNYHILFDSKNWGEDTKEIVKELLPQCKSWKLPDDDLIDDQGTASSSAKKEGSDDMSFSSSESDEEKVHYSPISSPRNG